MTTWTLKPQAYAVVVIAVCTSLVVDGLVAVVAGFVRLSR